MEGRGGGGGEKEEGGKEEKEDYIHMAKVTTQTFLCNTLSLSPPPSTILASSVLHDLLVSFTTN